MLTERDMQWQFEILRQKTPTTIYNNHSQRGSSQRHDADDADHADDAMPTKLMKNIW